LRKNHIVSLEEEEWDLAKTLGLVNLSEYVRDCISYFISGTDRELTHSEIRELSKKFALEKRAALLKQQKITGQTDEERQKIEEFKAKRMARIAEAVQTEAYQIGNERFKKYLDDPFGDYSTVQDGIIAAVSKASGYQVDLSDVITAFKTVLA